MTKQEAWQRCQSIWEAHGRPVPCWAPDYLTARYDLALVKYRAHACDEHDVLRAACDAGVPEQQARRAFATQ